MSSSISYLTSKANFVQVSSEVPITKQRNPDKVDPPDVFEGMQPTLTERFLYQPFNSQQERTSDGLDGEGEASRVPDQLIAAARTGGRAGVQDISHRYTS